MWARGRGGGTGERRMWYVMQVYTGREMEICEKCRSRIMGEGEDIFVPLAERMARVRGEWTVVTSRLFPGYVFAETGRVEDFHARLRQIRDMTRILGCGETMVPVRPEEEERIRRLCGEGHIAKYSEGYIEGDTLVITDGALKNFEGRVRKIFRHKRLVILEVPLLDQVVEVTLGLGVVSRQGSEDVCNIRTGPA